MARLFAKVVDDFRHLLALGVLLLFAFSLIWGLLLAGENVDPMLSVLQTVVGVFGGLTGVIAGFYFGEGRQFGGGSTLGVDGGGDQTGEPGTDGAHPRGCGETTEFL